MTAYYNEIDPYAAAWLRNLISAGIIAPGDVDERDIRDVRPDDLRGYTQCHFFAGIGVWSFALRLAGWPDDRPVWTGSCPCQPFSTAGRGGGFDDERHLWPAFFHLICQCRPPTIFGEQVASADGLGWLDLVQADLEGTGHAFWPVDLCAAGVGAPHIRQRLWWVADAYGSPGEQGRSIHRGRDPRSRALARAGLGGSVGPGELADPDQHGRFASPLPERRAAERHAEPCGIVGDTGSAGLALGSVAADERRALRVEGTALGAAEPLRGFWGGSDWVWCRDGKYRPVEPGSFPLVDGASARVGRLRAYGNAISPWPAAEVIGSYLDIEIFL